MRPGHARHRHLGEIVERVDPVMVRVVRGGAVRHLDQKTARALDQQRQTMVRRDQVRMNAETEHAQTVLQIMLPDGLVPFLEVLAAPQVVDEDVETTLLGPDARDQLGNLVRDEMIDLDGDTVAAGCGDELRRFLDGFRPRILGLLLTRRPTRHIDGCTCGSQFDRDAATRAARCACDQGDFSFEAHRALPKRAPCLPTHPFGSCSTGQRCRVLTRAVKAPRG